MRPDRSARKGVDPPDEGDRKSSGANLLLEVPWDRVIEDLGERGWSSITAAAGPELIGQLAEDDRRQWRQLEDEGVAHQDGFGAYLPFSETKPAVQHVGNELTSRLSRATRGQHPALPAFNEVTWTRYPPHRGQITAHRDPVAYVGVVAIFTLQGSAVFRVIDAHDITEWETGPGHLVVLRGADWPREGDRSPRHEVDPPAILERMILTLRSNRGGAGGGYSV